jgi:hypothetical protein
LTEATPAAVRMATGMPQDSATMKIEAWKVVGKK